MDLDKEAVQRVEQGVQGKPSRASAAVKTPWFQSVASGFSTDKILAGLGEKMKGGNESFRFDVSRQATPQLLSGQAQQPSGQCWPCKGPA